MNEEKSPEWERDVINKLAFAALNEQRRSRRWGIFFKLLFLGYFIALLVAFTASDTTATKGLPVGDHTGLVDLNGIIADDADASADNIVTGLREAMENKHSRGVIIRANSPGGSPVQAAYIYDEILRLRKKYPDKPIYAVVSDVCASACYYIISAADRIYANKVSLVGSIGVLINSFGFVDAMHKLGVERRLYTAGKNKGILDPFSPAKESDVEHISKVLEESHQVFIDAVKQGRGNRLKDDPDLFSGLFWGGERAKELGLVDEFASSSTVARDVIKQEDIVDYTPDKTLLDKLMDRLGASMAKSLMPNSTMQMR
jgi:protease-4